SGAVISCGVSVTLASSPAGRAGGAGCAGGTLGCCAVSTLGKSNKARTRLSRAKRGFIWLLAVRLKCKQRNERKYITRFRAAALSAARIVWTRPGIAQE